MGSAAYLEGVGQGILAGRQVFDTIDAGPGRTFAYACAQARDRLGAACGLELDRAVAPVAYPAAQAAALPHGPSHELTEPNALYASVYCHMQALLACSVRLSMVGHCFT
jgi:hypothetical protein